MTSWLAFTPRDTVLVRDGRRFTAGTDTSAEPSRPWPSTVGGAIYAAYGAQEPAKVRGPLPALRAGASWSLHLPAPADLTAIEDEPCRVAGRLRPQRLPVATDLDSGCEQLLVGDGEPVQGWLPVDQIGAYLADEMFDMSGRPWRGHTRVRTFDPFLRERHIGLARTNDRVARSRFLYQATHLRLLDGWALLAECEEPPADRLAVETVPLGGRGRLADVAVAAGVGWPAMPTAFPDGRVLVYVATPAIWDTGWRIPVPDGAHLVAAAVGGAEAVATASPRQGMRSSRMLRWAVPAGSVYLLRFDDADMAAAWALDVHAKAYGRPDLESPAGPDRLAGTGFGVILIGVWS